MIAGKYATRLTGAGLGPANDTTAKCKQPGRIKRHLCNSACVPQTSAQFLHTIPVRLLHLWRAQGFPPAVQPAGGPESQTYDRPSRLGLRLAANGLRLMTWRSPEGNISVTIWRLIQDMLSLMLAPPPRASCVFEKD
jgi:hypothetical protein